MPAAAVAVGVVFGVYAPSALHDLYASTSVMRALSVIYFVILATNFNTNQVNNKRAFFA